MEYVVANVDIYSRGIKVITKGKRYKVDTIDGDWIKVLSNFNNIQTFLIEKFSSIQENRNEIIDKILE